MKPNILTETNLKHYFFEKLREAMARYKIRLSGEVEVYLLDMLTRFAKTESLFPKNSQGRLEDRALALRLYDATFADHKDSKMFHLKSLGDTALYRAGVFYQGVQNQVVDVDYYVRMGGQAYFSLASLTTSREKSLADLFQELAEQFQTLVEILHWSFEGSSRDENTDLVRLLDHYNKTKSARAREILQDQGLDLQEWAPARSPVQ